MQLASGRGRHGGRGTEPRERAVRPLRFTGRPPCCTRGAPRPHDRPTDATMSPLAAPERARRPSGPHRWDRLAGPAVAWLVVAALAAAAGVAVALNTFAGLAVAVLVLAFGIFVADPILVAVIVLPGSILIQQGRGLEHQPQCGRSPGLRGRVRLPVPHRMVRGPPPPPVPPGDRLVRGGPRSWWSSPIRSGPTSSSGSTGSPTWPAAPWWGGSSPSTAGPARPSGSTCGERASWPCWPSSTQSPATSSRPSGACTRRTPSGPSCGWPSSSPT